MAGDWIKMTHALPEKPEVLAISRRTGLNRFDVVGRLFMLWRWFDTNTVDGNAVGVTSVTLNECLFGYGDVTGFVAAVVSENWLDESEHGLSVVKFDEHISESAKKRAQTAKRVDKHKKKASGNAVTNDKVTHATLPDALPREDKEKDISSSLRSEEKARASRLAQDWTLPDEWSDWCRENRPDLDPKTVAYSFADYWHSKAGKDGRKADWFATWRNWCRNQRKELVGASKALQRAPTAAEQRVLQACPDLAAPHLRQVQPLIFDMEAGDDAPKLLG